jgi:hypothetical protein
MLQTIWRLGRVDLGFRPEGVLTLRLQTTFRGTGSGERNRTFYAQVLERIEAVPGVVAAGAVQHLPLSGIQWGGDLEVEGQPLPAGATPPEIGFRLVAHETFEAMGIDLVQGRRFSTDDGPERPPVVS